MSEMVEHWRQMREERQARRRGSLQSALESFQAAADAVTEANPRCVLTQSTETHWLVLRDGRPVIAWWPSTCKVQGLPGGRVRSHQNNEQALSWVLRLAGTGAP